MTGWRLGYTAAPAAIAEAIDNLQSHTTSNPTTFAQIRRDRRLADGSAGRRRHA